MGDIPKFVQMAYGLLIEPDAVDFLTQTFRSCGVQSKEQIEQSTHKIVSMVFRKFGKHSHRCSDGG